MNMTDLRKKAKPLGIDAGKMKKEELIHSIQRAEGFTACFGKSNNQCQYTECCFREDCFKIK